MNILSFKLFSEFSFLFWSFSIFQFISSISNYAFRLQANCIIAFACTIWGLWPFVQYRHFDFEFNFSILFFSILHFSTFFYIFLHFLHFSTFYIFLHFSIVFFHFKFIFDSRSYLSRLSLFIGPTMYADFSFHEHGYYDIPAMLDYIRLNTGHKKVFYVGYSLGGTVYLAMGASRPEYNNKVRHWNSIDEVFLKWPLIYYVFRIIKIKIYINF